MPSADICQRAVVARDPRFDGVFYVGITSTGVYCRPVCPSRFATPRNRRFFASAASAEHAGFRPCLRCRPELAPGRAQMDSLPRLAAAAADRIAAGALNGHTVADLASELGVSERHLRRAVERAIGVPPIALAQTHRLLLAKQLLVDTSLTVTQIAFASGFQSLRRFNAAFREHYRLSPSDLRRPRPLDAPDPDPADLVHLTLSYRPPLAWDPLIAGIATNALPGAEAVTHGRYARTVRLNKRTGLAFVERPTDAKPHVTVSLSPSLLPALMPLLARLRRLFDLDAEPTVVGLRVPGAFDGFEIALALLLSTGPEGLAQRIVTDLGDTITTATTTTAAANPPALTHLAPRAAQVARAGTPRLVALGAPPPLAASIDALARAVTNGSLTLEPGADAIVARQQLMRLPGLGEDLATTIATRALHWPVALPPAGI